MLKVGGENVGAIEIESFLATHPAVSVVAVVGVPDPRYMEVPAAFVELRPGHEVTDDRAARVRPPRAGPVQGPAPRPLCHEWPMSATKIKKYELRERLALELEAERQPA